VNEQLEKLGLWSQSSQQGRKRFAVGVKQGGTRWDAVSAKKRGKKAATTGRVSKTQTKKREKPFAKTTNPRKERP